MADLENDTTKSLARTYVPTMRLRWAVPPHTTTKPPVLQQAWICRETGEHEWEDVETVIVPDKPDAT